MSLQSLALIENWPAQRRRGGRPRGRHRARHARPGRPPLPAGLGHQAARRVRRARGVREGAVELDEPAGRPAPRSGTSSRTPPGWRSTNTASRPHPGTRLYSNAGFEVLGDHVAKATDIRFFEYVRQALLEPLGMDSTSLDGSPAKDGVSTVADLVRFAAEVQAPRLLDPRTVGGDDGAVPGHKGRAARVRAPEPQRLGARLRDPGLQIAALDGWFVLAPDVRSLRAVGTFLWIDPDAGAACVALTDRAFGPWAAEAWTPFTDAVWGTAGLRRPATPPTPRPAAPPPSGPRPPCPSRP